MKPFKNYLIEDKYAEAGIDHEDVKSKIKHHEKESVKLSKELSKHNKTSLEYRSLRNDITNHEIARNSYDRAKDSIKRGYAPSQVKGYIKSAENHASKVSGHIPEVAKKPEKIKNIHDHVHAKLKDAGFDHSEEKKQEKTEWSRRSTPYGDSRSFTQKGKRTDTYHTYTKEGTAQDAAKVKKSLEKDNLHGERGDHHISVRHSEGQIKVLHRITGKSEPDHKSNEREYNYQTAAHLDPEHWGTRYHSWRKR